MAKELFEGMTPKEIKPLLEANADSKEMGSYTRVLEKEELTQAKERFSKDSASLAKLADELDAVKSVYKQKMKPLMETTSADLHIIRFGSVEEEGEIFTIKDFINKRIARYNAEGEFIDSRRMRPEESEAQNTLQNAIRMVKGGADEADRDQYGRTGTTE